MIKKLLNNQSGFSLVMAIVAFTVVASGTYYLMEVQKANRRNEIKARTINSFEAEKKRITAIFSDSENCKQVFSGKTTNFTWSHVAGPPPVPFNFYYGTGTAPGTIPFLTSGLQASTKLTLVTAKITFTAATPNSGILTLTFNNSFTGGKAGYTGKNFVQMYIPFYQTSTAGAITGCYALVENQNLTTSIQSACSNSAALDSYSNYNSTNGATNNCSTNFTLNGSTAANASIDCGTLVGSSTALTGFDVVATSAPDTGRTVSIPTTKCSSFANGASGSCTLASQRVYGASSGAVSCAIPGGDPRDVNNCAGGQIPYKTGANSVTCVSPTNCTGVNFVSGLSSAGTSCTSANTVPCPAGSYARSFNQATGTVTCAPFPVMSGSCAAGSFGVSFTRNDATNNGTLNCSPYTKTKPCPSYNYLSSLSASGTANCTPY